MFLDKCALYSGYVVSLRLSRRLFGLGIVYPSVLIDKYSLVLGRTIHVRSHLKTKNDYFSFYVHHF